MTKRNYFSKLIIILIMIISCDNSSDLTENQANNQLEQALHYLAKQGIPVENYHFDGKFIRIQNDILFDIEHVHNDINERNKQYLYKYKVSHGNIDGIKVKIDTNVPQNWKTATLEAMQEWNDVSHSSVSFIEVTGTSYDIRVRYLDVGNNGTIADASFPYQNKPGNIIRINPNFVPVGDFHVNTAARKKYIMVHEFGHTIGFAHANADNSRSIGPDDPEGGFTETYLYIEGTKLYDNQSVMRPSFVKDWTGFSFFDKEAARATYLSDATTSISSTIATPTNLSYSYNGSSFTLNWSDNANNETSYNIYKLHEHTNPQNGSTSAYLYLTTLAPNTTSYNVGPENNKLYKVKAVYHDLGSEFSNSVNTIRTVPLAPSGLSYSNATTSSVSLNWSDNSNNENGFKIERKTGSGNFSVIKTVAANSTSTSISGLAANTLYSYRIASYNNAGNSAYSNTISVSTAGSLNFTINGPSSVPYKDRVNQYRFSLNITGNYSNIKWYLSNSNGSYIYQPGMENQTSHTTNNNEYSFTIKVVIDGLTRYKFVRVTGGGTIDLP